MINRVSSAFRFYVKCPGIEQQNMTDTVIQMAKEVSITAFIPRPKGFDVFKPTQNVTLSIGTYS